MEDYPFFFHILRFFIEESFFTGFIIGLGVSWIYNSFADIKKKKKEKENIKKKLYFPFINCLTELDARFTRILGNLETDWLDSKYLKSIKKGQGFAIDPNQKGYFVLSSIYLIASFFSYCEVIKRDIDIEIAKSEQIFSRKFFIKKCLFFIQKFFIKKKIFTQFDLNIKKICRLFQHKEFFDNYLNSKNFTNPIDASKLTKHIRHSIGEMMLKKDDKDGEVRVKSFREFFNSYISDDKFRFWILLIEDLFVDLSNFGKDKNIEKQIRKKNDIRPLRIIAIQYWCRVLMQKISEELKLKITPQKAKDVLKGLNDELKKLIVEHEDPSDEKVDSLGMQLKY